MADDGNPTITSTVSKLGQSVIGALPPAFLLLCLINAIFIGVVMWFLDSQLKQRTELVSEVVNKCMDIALHAPPPAEHH
jgi:uncharacterized protein (UPF0333 family)